MDLAEFLLARIAEDERAARAARDRGSSAYDWAVLRDRGFILADSHHIPRWQPARVLAECDAKRRIVEAAGPTDEWESDYAQGIDHALRCLALPYADHPDYDESWRP